MNVGPLQRHVFIFTDIFAYLYCKLNVWLHTRGTTSNIAESLDRTLNFCTALHCFQHLYIYSTWIHTNASICVRMSPTFVSSWPGAAQVTRDPKAEESASQKVAAAGAGACREAHPESKDMENG